MHDVTCVKYAGFGYPDAFCNLLFIWFKFILICYYIYIDLDYSVQLVPICTL